MNHHRSLCVRNFSKKKDHLPIPCKSQYALDTHHDARTQSPRDEAQERSYLEVKNSFRRVLIIGFTTDIYRTINRDRGHLKHGILFNDSVDFWKETKVTTHRSNGVLMIN